MPWRRRGPHAPCWRSALAFLRFERLQSIILAALFFFLFSYFSYFDAFCASTARSDGSAKAVRPTAPRARENHRVSMSLSFILLCFILFAFHFLPHFRTFSPPNPPFLSKRRLNETIASITEVAAKKSELEAKTAELQRNLNAIMQETTEKESKLREQEVC